jgi:hypothetical protein
MAVIETTTFRLADDVDEAEFLAVDEAVRTGFLYHQSGIVRATTARGDDGEWIVVVLWMTYEDADAAAEVERTDPATDRFAHMIVGADRRRYTLFD